MSTKVCNVCGIEKSLADFFKATRNKDGYYNRCKDCHREKNKKNVYKYLKKYQKTDKWKETLNRYQQSEKGKASLKRYRQSEKGKKALSRVQKKYLENPENRAKHYKLSAENQKKRYNENPEFKFIHDMRNMINYGIKRGGFKKKARTTDILGCSIEDFKKHIENQFDSRMNWDNRGEWELDHIIPVSSAENEFEAIALNHHSNFQPLWEDKNIEKRDNYNPKDKSKYLKWYKENISK
jgi:hypothetical protein